MEHKSHRVSFLIRFWREPDSLGCEGEGAWRAQVMHVQSGTSLYVDSVIALIVFMEQWTGPLHESQSAWDCDDQDSREQPRAHRPRNGLT